MLVKEIMDKDFVVVNPHITVQEAAEKMTEAQSKCLIVVEQKKLAGIITDWDFVSKVVAEAKDPKKLKIKEIMTTDVIVVSPDLSIEEAADLMFKNNIKKLPVVAGNVLIGVVTAREIIAAEPKLIEQVGNLIQLSKKSKSVAG